MPQLVPLSQPPPLPLMLVAMAMKEVEVVVAETDVIAKVVVVIEVVTKAKVMVVAVVEVMVEVAEAKATTVAVAVVNFFTYMIVMSPRVQCFYWSVLICKFQFVDLKVMKYEDYCSFYFSASFLFSQYFVKFY